MATQIGIGFSQSTDAQTAARDAAFDSKTDLNADRIDLALIFSTIHYDPQQTVPVLHTVLNEANMIGCSTAGIILSNAIESRGIAVLTVSSDEIKFGTGCVADLNTQDIHRAGALLARDTLSHFGRHSRQAFVFLVDGHLENNSILLKGSRRSWAMFSPFLARAAAIIFIFWTPSKFIRIRYSQKPRPVLL